MKEKMKKKDEKILKKKQIVIKLLKNINFKKIGKRKNKLARIAKGKY